MKLSTSIKSYINLLLDELESFIRNFMELYNCNLVNFFKVIIQI